MSGLTGSQSPLTGAQIAARLQAVGFTAAQSEAVMAVYRDLLSLAFTLHEEGIPIPESLENQLDDFDPDSASDTQETQ
jgi:hypothetical protein